MEHREGFMPSLTLEPLGKTDQWWGAIFPLCASLGWPQWGLCECYMMMRRGHASIWCHTLKLNVGIILQDVPLKRTYFTEQNDRDWMCSWTYVKPLLNSWYDIIYKGAVKVVLHLDLPHLNLQRWGNQVCSLGRGQGSGLIHSFRDKRNSVNM